MLKEEISALRDSAVRKMFYEILYACLYTTQNGAQYIVHLVFISFVVGERFRGGKPVTERGRNAKRNSCTQRERRGNGVLDNLLYLYPPKFLSSKVNLPAFYVFIFSRRKIWRKKTSCLEKK